MTQPLPTLEDFRLAVDRWVQTAGRAAKPIAYLGHTDHMELLRQARQGFVEYVNDPKGGRGRWKIMGVPTYRVDADRHFHITDHP